VAQVGAVPGLLLDAAGVAVAGGRGADGAAVAKGRRRVGRERLFFWFCFVLGSRGRFFRSVRDVVGE
jgi:hypothetical protein